MNQSITWKMVPAEPTIGWTNAFAARGPRIGTFDTTIRDVLATAPAPAFDLQQALRDVRAALAFLPPTDAAVAGLDRIIAIFGTAAATAQDDTLARTGNTDDHQEGWYAGIEHERAEARDNAGIGARQLQERADKVVITNATGDPDLFLQAVKDLLAAVRIFRPTPAMGIARDAERYHGFRTAIANQDVTWLDIIDDALMAMGTALDEAPTAEQVDQAVDAAIATRQGQRTGDPE